MNVTPGPDVGLMDENTLIGWLLRNTVGQSGCPGGNGFNLWSSDIDLNDHDIDLASSQSDHRQSATAAGDL